MSRIKTPAGNLIYPPTKILINDTNVRNIENYFKVIDDSGNSRLLLHMPKEGVQIGTDENFTVEVFEGHDGTKKVSIIEILGADACTECRFEYGFGVLHRYYNKKEQYDPYRHVTNGYYAMMSNPSAIDPTTGLLTTIALTEMHSELKTFINSHVGVHPDAGPVVKATDVYVITRDDADPFDVDITGTAPATVTGASPALLATALNSNVDVIYAWATTTNVYVVMAEGATIASGTAKTHVALDVSRICLEGLYSNPYFEVVNPKGFRINVINAIEPTREYLTYEQIFDLFFNQKHQGSISQWTNLNQPINSLYIKILIKVASETHAIHGASHTNGYVHVYEIYCPIALLPVIYDPTSQTDDPIFGVVGDNGQFPIDSEDYSYGG